jgi:alpha-amylase
MAAEGARALEAWRTTHPDRAMGDLPFWMMGEVYGYGASGGRDFDFGDRTVDYFDFGYDALINFGFKTEARGGVEALEAVYARYAELLNGGELEGVSIVNYIASHDDGSPLDRDRDEPFFTSAKLMLAPGAAQIYYGDETLRPLRIEGAEGDANLRSFMNWEALESDDFAAGVLQHWQALAAFRARHPAVGAGEHRMIRAEPYVFSRVLEWEEGRDAIVAGVGLPLGEKVIPVGGVFRDGTTVVDAWSGQTALVRDGVVLLDTTGEVVLLEASTRQR